MAERPSITLVLVAMACLLAGSSLATSPRSFTLEDNRFVQDGNPIRIISCEIHYHRIHPAYWQDRLTRVKSLGCNAIQFLVPWNVHEPYFGKYDWKGFANLERWLQLTQKAGLLALIRPGPYICGEWENGGFPWWFGSSEITGGHTMKVRSSDPNYLLHVDRWWGQLLPKIGKHLYSRGGPLVMLQLENEYGYCGADHEYVRHLLRLARASLGDGIIYYTTDPPPLAVKGSLPGEEVYTVVDFGAGWYPLPVAFGAQALLNAPGKSPPFCSEFYTGWLSHWGEKMANNSADVMLAGLKDILAYANNTGSVSFYMAHGGTNFGWWAGANEAGNVYQPHITSYDYNSPISESGDYGQPGIGGPNKFELMRKVIEDATGVTPIDPLPRPVMAAYGSVTLTQQAVLLEQVPGLYPGDGLLVDQPGSIEEYNQPHGLTVFRAMVPTSLFKSNTTVLDLGGPVHDYAKVLLDGKLVGKLERGQATTLVLPAVNHLHQTARLDIVVEAMGRQNFECLTMDFKGLTSGRIKINGQLLSGWRVFPLLLDDLSPIQWGSAPAANQPKKDPTYYGAMLYKGTLHINASKTASGHLPDTYLNPAGWARGVAWVNGFNLGWYWPARGPQMRQYVPGPVLRPGANDVILMETDGAPLDPTVSFEDAPDFFGPGVATMEAAEPRYYDKGYALGVSQLQYTASLTTVSENL